MADTPRRVTAQIVNSSVFEDGEFVSEDNFSNYILYKGKKLFKLNIIGTIVSKNEGNSFVSFVVDDGFGQFEVRAFGEISSFSSLVVGSIVLVVGRPRKWQDNVYMNADFVKIISPLWAKHRKLVLAESTPLSISEEVVETKPQTKQKNIVEEVLLAIKKADSGDGADIDDVINIVGTDKVESVVDRLIEQGDVFEFKPGRIKLLQ